MNSELEAVISPNHYTTEAGDLFDKVARDQGYLFACNAAAFTALRYLTRAGKKVDAPFLVDVLKAKKCITRLQELKSEWTKAPNFYGIPIKVNTLEEKLILDCNTYLRDLGEEEIA